MLGVLANSGAVLVGGVVGLLFRGKINEKYTSALMAALALVSLGLGIICVVGTADTLCLILCTAVGTLIGELIRIDDRVEALGALAEKKLSKSEGGFAQAFVSCSILFCIGSMAVMGSIEAGINGDNSILYAKAVLDLVASLAFGAGLGAGVVASGICVFVCEGALTLLASALSPYLTQAVVSEMSAVGGVLLLGLAINLLGLRQERLRVANMLPGVFLPIAYIPLYQLI
ncbi:MAG TPA: DUF554 domain-containing protein, partial [Candidatus Scatomorpha merdavium]|nr:DUF554 domain-containing protein [Candidatus Scatomorpha merdavium]